MGLVIERHPSDPISFSKIIIRIGKKQKYKLKAGEKIDIPLTEGRYTLSVSVSFWRLYKKNIEINYPGDKNILVSHWGSSVFLVPNTTLSSVNDTENKFCFPSRVNGIICGKLSINSDRIEFWGMDEQLIELKMEDIQSVSIVFKELFLQPYTGLGYSFSIPKAEINEVTEFIQAQVNKSAKKLQNGFDLIFGIDEKIEINEEKEEFHIRNDSWVSCNYKLEDIISYESNELTAKADYLGGALAGNLLGGPAGALFGVMHAAGASNKVEYVKMNLNVKTENGIEALSINFGKPIFAAQKNSNKYAMYIAECSKFIAFMDAWKKEKESKIMGRDNPNSISDDAMEEIRKYKLLLDEGIIDENEFNQKKKQLLGIELTPKS